MLSSLYLVSFCFYSDKSRENYLGSYRLSLSYTSLKLLFKGSKMIKTPTNMFLWPCLCTLSRLLSLTRSWKYQLETEPPSKGRMNQTSPFNMLTVALRECLVPCTAQPSKHNGTFSLGLPHSQWPTQEIIILVVTSKQWNILTWKISSFWPCKTVASQAGLKLVSTQIQQLYA